jgi:hypothetical protein
MTLEVIYKETIGTATITLNRVTSIWYFVTLEDIRINAETKRRDFGNYQNAIKCYDDTCNFASRLYSVKRVLPEKIENYWNV